MSMFKRTRREIPGLNTSSLPDLIFTVLFFFMIVTHMRKVTLKVKYQVPQVTKLKFNGKRLYSSSYDGKLLFWMTNDQQIKPITLFQSSSWLTDFVFSTDKDYIWTGEQNGTVNEYLISLPKIANRLSQKVKRDFTQEEWKYYVGKGIPFRKLKE